MTDLVNRPPHYADGWSNGAEVIDITENLNFNRGNAVKYIARAGKKDPTKELEDLLKAQFYLNREVARVELVTPVDQLPVSGKEKFSQHGDFNRNVVGFRLEAATVLAPEPRVWSSLVDVPIVVRVEDSDGHTWKHDAEKGWIWRIPGGSFWHEVTNVQDFDGARPFTEILEGSE